MHTLHFSGQTIFIRAIARFWYEPDTQDDYRVNIELINGSLVQQRVTNTLPGGYSAHTNAEMVRDQIARAVNEYLNSQPKLF